MLLGIDEVGRGPWAGPLVIGAVILGPDFEQLPEYAELRDSKKLTAKKREALNSVILERSAAAGLGWVSSRELDERGLGPSLRLAARRAVKQVLAIKVPFDEILIDGTINLLSDTPLAERVSLLPKADALVKEVSAASIIAKVARDRYMAALEEKYPGYNFAQNVGYGTAAHRAALLDLGPCPEHRQSFRPVAEISARFGLTPSGQAQSAAKPPLASQSQAPASGPRPAQPRKNTTAIGQKAEFAVAARLEAEGHTLIAHNYKTKAYEIDLISMRCGEIFFTEVKYRRSATRGGPLEAVGAQKHAQIRRAAEAFLASRPELASLRPRLAVACVTGPDFIVTDLITLEE